MSEYYAVQRSGDELQHYGVKGMKWGVRKAIQSGNSRALGRQFKKASKKLAKLEKRGANGKKYAKRAAAYGLGAAAAGGLAAAGTSGVGKGLQRLSTLAINGRGQNKFKNARRAVNEAGKAVEKWGRGMTPTGITRNHNGITQELHIKNGGAARYAAGALGAGLAVAAGRNAYKAATAKRNRKKAETFRAEMKKTFAGTEYANKIPANKIPANKSQAKSKAKTKSKSSTVRDGLKAAALSTVMGPSAAYYVQSKRDANSIPANNNRHGKKRSRRR